MEMKVPVNDGGVNEKSYNNHDDYMHDNKRNSVAPINTHDGCDHSHGGGYDRKHWKRFMEHTSCHGVFQIQNSNTKTGQWIWIVIVIGAIAGLLAMVG